MRTRILPLAVLAAAVLAAQALPAFAWNAPITATSDCVPGAPVATVRFTVAKPIEDWAKGAEARVLVSNSDTLEVVEFHLGPNEGDSFSASFAVPVTGAHQLTVTADTQWKNHPPTSAQTKVALEDCEAAQAGPTTITLAEPDVTIGSPPDQAGRPGPRVVDKDCADFTSREQAQAFLDANDSHHLDADHDGVACEQLPSRASKASKEGTLPFTGQRQTTQLIGWGLIGAGVALIFTSRLMARREKLEQRG